MVYAIRTIQCRNGVVEKTKFPVHNIADRSEARTRKGKREINRAAKNTGDARRNFARVLNNNFLPGDLFLTLDLTDAGLAKVDKRAEKLRVERAKAVLPELPFKDLPLLALKQEDANFYRRVRRKLSTLGVPYFFTTAPSDMNGPEDYEHSARPHIHVVVNKAILGVVEEKWKAMGSVKWVPLSAWASKNGAPDWTALAAYIIGQTRVVDGCKRYTVSRTIQIPRPDPKDDRIAIRPEALLRAPKGAVLLEQGPYFPGRAQYIRYIYPAWVDRGEEDADGLPT